eukprot:4133973-Pleurochrysis_carterae.AAC.1
MGRPCDKNAGASFYLEHHLSQVAAESFFELPSSTKITCHCATSRMARGGVTSGAAEGADCKGYHTFRRFDVMELLHKPDSAKAAFWPSEASKLYYLRRDRRQEPPTTLAVPCIFADRHEQNKTHPHFFFASWTARQGAQRDLGTPELTLSTVFDPNNEDAVRVATNEQRTPMGGVAAGSHVAGPSAREAAKRAAAERAAAERAAKRAATKQAKRAVTERAAAERAAAADQGAYGDTGGVVGETGQSIQFLVLSCIVHFIHREAGARGFPLRVRFQRLRRSRANSRTAYCPCSSPWSAAVIASVLTATACSGRPAVVFAASSASAATAAGLRTASTRTTPTAPVPHQHVHTQAQHGGNYQQHDHFQYGGQAPIPVQYQPQHSVGTY